MGLARKHGVMVEICQDGMSFEESRLLESWLIAMLSKEGYSLINKSRGGEGISSSGTPVYSSLGESFESITSASVYLMDNGYPKASSSAISTCCHGRAISAYGRAWSFSGFPIHPEYTGSKAKGFYSRVVRAVRVRGKYGEFDSINAAVAWLRLNGHPKASRSAVSSAINGKCRRAYGSEWRII